MIKEVASIELPVHESMVVRKNRLMPKNYKDGDNVPRISIVTGIHGDELDGQYICYEVIRRINQYPEKLKGIIDIYPDINPLGIDIGTRGIPMFELDMNRVFPGDNNGAVAESVAAGIVNDIIGSDFCLDIHSSNIFVREMPQVRLNDDNVDRLLPYAKMLNADFVWIFSSITVLDATLASCVYLAEGPQEPDNILKQFVTLKGSKYWIALLYMTLYYGLILVGMFLSARFAVKRKSDAKAVDMPIFASSITMLGIALFQTIWECNSRYLVVFIPIMILLAADGFFAWRDYLRGERIK